METPVPSRDSWSSGGACQCRTLHMHVVHSVHSFSLGGKRRGNLCHGNQRAKKPPVHQAGGFLHLLKTASPLADQRAVKTTGIAANPPGR